MANDKRPTTRLPDEHYEIANEYDLEIIEVEDRVGMFVVRKNGDDVTYDPIDATTLHTFLIGYEVGYLECRSDADEAKAAAARPKPAPKTAGR